MPGILDGFKDWMRDPETSLSLRKAGKVAALSGTCCIFGGVIFGPAGIGISGMTFGVSYYLMEICDFGSAGLSLMNHLTQGSQNECEAISPNE